MKIIKALTVIVVVFFVVVLFCYSKEDVNFIRSAKMKNIVRSVFPQGWAFFTKEVHGEELQLFKVKKGHLEELSLRGESSFVSFDRFHRIILYYTSNSKRVECIKGDYNCYFSKPLIIESRFIKSGSYLNVSSRKRHWAYRNIAEKNEKVNVSFFIFN